VLAHLAIRNFTIVDRLGLDLEPGLTALTGETGAGKSILVGALGLALGERAGADAIRPGGERTEVSAVFELGQLAAVREWLAERELDVPEEECVVRRTLGADGRSRAYVNGHPVAIATLRELGDRLVDIHGQHAHQSLLRSEVQRRLLDDYAGHAQTLASVAELHQRLRAIERETEALGGDARDRASRLDILRYQRHELEALGLEPGELETLESEHRRLAHMSELIASCQAALERLGGEQGGATLSALEHTVGELDALSAHDARLTAIRDLLDSAAIGVREALTELRHYADRLEPEPDRLAALEKRLAAVHDLARKHRVPATELPELSARLDEELAALSGAEARLAELERERQTVEERYRELARALHESRVRATSMLEEELRERLDRLGMPGARAVFSVEHAATGRHAASGLDRVELLVATNPGQDLRPLAKVVSGGELSRLSLALQLVTAQGTGVPSLVFDEVDAGIGGRVAEIVGQTLRALGEHRQVLCVTHLPQVASQAHHHIRVAKSTAEGAVRASLEPLAGESRVREVARMLGGVRITARALAHAREMLGHRVVVS